MPPKPVIALLAVGLLALVARRADAESTDLEAQVESTERAFAATMAERDFEAFTSFLSEEAIFISGSTLRGKQQVADAWKPYFDGPAAPFSWQPETVEVNDSGALALSTGPVRDASGNLVATFTSIWRQEEPGVWRIVFDKGNLACPPTASASPAPEPEAAGRESPEE